MCKIKGKSLVIENEDKQAVNSNYNLTNDHVAIISTNKVSQCSLACENRNMNQGINIIFHLFH